MKLKRKRRKKCHLTRSQKGGGRPRWKVVTPSMVFFNPSLRWNVAPQIHLHWWINKTYTVTALQHHLTELRLMWNSDEKHTVLYLPVDDQGEVGLHTCIWVPAHMIFLWVFLMIWLNPFTQATLRAHYSLIHIATTVSPQIPNTVLYVEGVLPGCDGALKGAVTGDHTMDYCTGLVW